jgi:hypothetical protein
MPYGRELTEEEADDLFRDADQILASRTAPRKRATNHQMEERAQFLIKYAYVHGPVTVRQLFYRAEVEGFPGVEKDESGYIKIQRQVLDLRREGRLPYEQIADATRWMRKPHTFSDPTQFLNSSIQLYRKALWNDIPETVEIWCEKDALAGVLYQVTELYDVPLMVTRGFSSETFCYEAIAQRHSEDDRPYFVYYLGDFDRSGVDAASALEEKLQRFAEGKFPVHFEALAVTLEQIAGMQLPTRAHKRESKADKNWPYDFACELDAIPPDDLRNLVETTIEKHLPEEELIRLKRIEEQERDTLIAFQRGFVVSG